jgi:hypothetical protein
MNNGFTTVVVLGLLLLADAFCLKQTLNIYNELDPGTAKLLLIAEALAASVIIVSSLFLLIRRNSKRSKFTRLRRPEASAQLRRLLAAVWS